MRDLTPFWYTAPDGAEFHLKPLDMPTHWELQAGMIGRRVPSWESVEAAVQACVIGWRGIKAGDADVPFTPAAKAEALSPSADPEWMLRWMSVAGELLRRASLTEAEEKKS